MQRVIVIIIALAIVAGVAFYVRAQDGHGPESGAVAGKAAPKGSPGAGMHMPPPPEVGVVEVQPVSMPFVREYVGTAEASSKVEIRARIRGIINKRHFEEGSLVKKGEPLYTIDSAPYRADLDIARAQLAQSQSRLTLAQRETARLQELNKENVISDSELDKQTSELDAAQAALSLSQAQLRKMELELGYTSIEAPITGLIERTFKETGSLVDDSANSLLTEILQVDPIYVTFQLSEAEFLETQQQFLTGVITASPGGETYVELTLIDGSVYPGKGSINFQDPSIDRQTGTVRYRAVFPNADGQLRPGQFVHVNFRGWERPNTFLVPQGAVNQAATGSFVYVVDGDNTARQRSVKLGDWAGNQWVVESGLQPGDRVIAEGTSKVMPDSPVIPAPISPEAVATTSTQLQ